MLGSDLVEALAGHDVTAPGHHEFDITDLAAVTAVVKGMDVVINAAAYTRVDDAESDETTATRINGTAAGTVATAARLAGARVVQLSTDYVFDGRSTVPYDERHPIDPVNAYGRSKAAGERAVLAAHPEGSYIVRTAWLYGAHGPNFARTILSAASTRQTLGVVNDQRGQPTWTADLAAAIIELLSVDAEPGVYHATNSGEASWFDFARAIFEQAGLDPARIVPTLSSEFARPAARPSYSVLGHRALDTAGVSPLRPWQEALAAASTAGALRG